VVHIVRTSITALAVVVLAGCGISMRAGADYDPDADFGGYESFTWAPPDALPTGDPRLDSNPFFVERIESAVSSELEARGLRHAPGSGDLTVHFHASVRDRTEVLETDERYGYETGTMMEGTRVIQYEEGTILVDVADRRSKELLWRGWAQADVQDVIGDPEQMRDRIRDAVEKMFQDFPLSASGVSGP